MQERPSSSAGGWRTNTPDYRGTGLSFRRVYHSTTGATPSQSRRTTGNYESIISHPPARAQADNTRPHRNIRHNKQRTITARNHTMLRGPCRTRTYDLPARNRALHPLS